MSEVRFLWYGLEPTDLDEQERALLTSLGDEGIGIKHEVLETFPVKFPNLPDILLNSGNGSLNVAVLQDAQGLILQERRYTPVHYDGAPDRFDGRNLIVLFADSSYRSGMIRQIRSWVLRALNPATEDKEVVGYMISEDEIAPNPWGRATNSEKKTRKKRPRGMGWQIQVATTLSAPIETVELEQEQREKEAAFVGVLGAFNYDVCMEMPDKQLHRIFLELRKRLALVAEASKTGGGEQFFQLVAQLSKEELLDREKVMPRLEAVLLYGRRYDQLLLEEQVIADRYEVVDEQSHFARIMDVGELRETTKHQVGIADAGNPFITRTLMNTVRYREDLGLTAYYPLPHEPIVENANFRNSLAPFQVRRKYPYVACVVSAKNEVLARDLMEIYRKLIAQYPLEITFLLMEEWLMRMRVVDRDVSFTAAQVFAKNGGYEVKLVNAGGGGAVLRGSRNELIRFDDQEPNSQERGYVFERPRVGNSDGQHCHSVQTVQVEPGDEIFVFPRTKELPAGLKVNELNRAQEVAIMVSARRHQRLTSFEWAPGYVEDQLGGLVDQITDINPERVEVQFGHIHGDREPDKDQIVGSFIAGTFVRQLMTHGIKNIATRPISDNYHVVDRLDFPAWINLLKEHSGLDITEVTFEDALISRHLADQLIAQLYCTQPDSIVFQGGNYYFSPPGTDTVVELYEGVRTPDVTGRQGCVPFQLGYELYRLNPDWVNAAYREYIMNSFPNSLVANWWIEDPETTYQELMLQHVYMLPCSERMALKAQVDGEIDQPYRLKCMSGDTTFLEGLLAATDLNEVVLLHVLEDFYATQEKKSTALWQALGLPRVHQWRISFSRNTGRIQALDWNRHLDG